MLEKRFNELYNRAYERGYCTFSQFLNMHEQSELKNLFLPCVMYGGYETAERVVAGFGEGLQISSFPIVCLCAKPLSLKFADDLTHRDFLGALMNLGIKRELVGDIIVIDNCGYILCLEHIAQYICENLVKVKHTAVKTEYSQLAENVSEQGDKVSVFSNSKRVDALISAVYNFSRSESLRLVSGEKVFVNSKLVLSAALNVEQGDIVSVRGYGRFKYIGEIKTTKKGRLVSQIEKF